MEPITARGLVLSAEDPRFKDNKVLDPKEPFVGGNCIRVGRRWGWGGGGGGQCAEAALEREQQSGGGAGAGGSQ